MKRKVSLFIAVLFCFSLIVSPVYAATEAELEQQKQQATEKMDAAKYQVDMTQNTIEGIQNELKKASTEIDKITSEVADLDSQISQLNTNLEKTKAELEEAKKKQAKQEEELKERLRVMYMYGTEGYVEILFSSTDFADLIAKADMMKSVMQADKDIASALEKTRNEVALKQAAIEEDKAKVETAKSEKQNSLDNQKSIKAQKDELLAKNQQVIKTYQAEIDKQEAVYQQANRELAQIAAAKEAEAARIRAEEEARLKAEAEANKNTGQNNGSGNTANNDSGTSWTPSSGLIWPVPGYGYSSITSWFGYRPAEDTNGVGTTNHGGVDVGIPTGTNVLAAGDGVVTYAGWNGGYGYCVMIAVDGGTVLYGHLSEVIVSDGQYVRQGQTVAYSGNSGNSTGPHLHLSFFDPDPTDPLNYMHW